MRTAIKIVFISLIILAITGCATTRHKKQTENAPAISAGDYNAVISAIKESNLVQNGFIIKKARIKT